MNVDPEQAFDGTGKKEQIENWITMEDKIGAILSKLKNRKRIERNKKRDAEIQK